MYFPPPRLWGYWWHFFLAVWANSQFGYNLKKRKLHCGLLLLSCVKNSILQLAKEVSTIMFLTLKNMIFCLKTCLFTKHCFYHSNFNCIWYTLAHPACGAILLFTLGFRTYGVHYWGVEWLIGNQNFYETLQRVNMLVISNNHHYCKLLAILRGLFNHSLNPISLILWAFLPLATSLSASFFLAL